MVAHHAARGEPPQARNDSGSLTLSLTGSVTPGGDFGLDGLGEQPPGASRRISVRTSWVAGMGTMRVSMVDVVDSFMAGYSSASWATRCARTACITKDTPPPFKPPVHDFWLYP